MNKPTLPAEPQRANIKKDMITSSPSEENLNALPSELRLGESSGELESQKPGNSDQENRNGQPDYDSDFLDKFSLEDLCKASASPYQQEGFLSSLQKKPDLLEFILIEKALQTNPRLTTKEALSIIRKTQEEVCPMPKNPQESARTNIRSLPHYIETNPPASFHTQAENYFLCRKQGLGVNTAYRIGVEILGLIPSCELLSDRKQLYDDAQKIYKKVGKTMPEEIKKMFNLSSKDSDPFARYRN